MKNKKHIESRKIEKSEEKSKQIENIKQITIEYNKAKITKSSGKKGLRDFIIGFIIALVVSGIVFFFNRSYIIPLIVFFVIIILIPVYSFIRRRLEKSEKVRRMEEVFPDFLQLMSSNLMAGITIDKSMLLSSRPEFYPLDAEIDWAGRDIATGKEIESALLDMSKRIGSEKIHKTILLLITGIRAGGNLAVLLEETAVNARERDFVEKRAASNVLMYVIFIFVAVAFGAPLLFSLSSVLVEILNNLMGGLPATTSAISVPFTLSKINVSINFIIYFSMFFILMIDILASLVLGLVSKGEEKQGVKYIIPLIIVSLGIFFVMRIFLLRFLGGMF